jgi:hypothetical protein
MFKSYLKYFVLVISFYSLRAEEHYIHHDLTIILSPENQSIQVTDNLVIPVDAIRSELYFFLHENLKITASSQKFQVRKVDEEAQASFFGLNENDFNQPEDVNCSLYKLESLDESENNVHFDLTFEGKINHPIQQLSKEYARGFSETPGIISEQGVYLAGSSYWLPWFNNQLVTFDMTVTVRKDWRVVSQGKMGTEKEEPAAYVVQWISPEPMEEVFLIAGRFIEYNKQIGNVTVQAFLRNADPSLAGKYLETTAQYLEMYNKLIGQYPYSKFALIENFWETGYGMPSFTLLGEKVIRFPFILHSSYPHELLHNWWGNSVLVDHKTGNWCEGLTTYMADHLIQEQRGQGAEYRRSALQAYTDYVNSSNEFSLSKFISRTDAASSAIGYNKSMMVFNMLRMETGDEIFKQALQKFYRSNKFHKASYTETKKAFEETSGKKYDLFFEQWVNRNGAPVLALQNAQAEKVDESWQLSIEIRQIQEGSFYDLLIPIAIYLEGEKEAKIENVRMTAKDQEFLLSLDTRPLTIDIDPSFDVFRLLNKNEIPPALSQIFGAEKVMIIIAAMEEDQKREAYKILAADWASGEPEKFEIVLDKDVENLPNDRAVWLFGRANKFKTVVVSGLKDFDFDMTTDQFRIGKSSLGVGQNSIIVSTRNPQNPENIIVWLSADLTEALPGLGRKLPHYGKYSYLAFEGPEPANILKGQWPAVNSPLSATIIYREKSTGDIEKGPLPLRPALAMLVPVFDEKQMKNHVDSLASEVLQGRELGSAGLNKAADYISTEFKKAGLQPGGDNHSYFQIWQENAGRENNLLDLKNIIGLIPGKNKSWADQAVVIGAHYDHLGLGWPDVRKGNEGKIHFGADDNASGVAVLLEIARLLGREYEPERTIIFVAFTGEESGLLGSKHFIADLKQFAVDKIIGMINLDTVGRLGKNKILIINSSSAAEWKHIAMGIGFVTGIDYELVMQDLDASDQVSFIKARIPAIQIFSGPNQDYHRPSDTADKIDAAGMVKIATFTREALVYLAERESPMTFTGSKPGAKSNAQTGGARQVGTGIMPDFAFQGVGVRAADVSPDSPAAKTGLKKGDVIIRLGEKSISDLKSYSEILKTYKPGDSATIVFIHEGQEITGEIILQAR